MPPDSVYVQNAFNTLCHLPFFECYPIFNNLRCVHYLSKFLRYAKLVIWKFNLLNVDGYFKYFFALIFWGFKKENFNIIFVLLFILYFEFCNDFIITGSILHYVYFLNSFLFFRYKHLLLSKNELIEVKRINGMSYYLQQFSSKNYMNTYVFPN